MQPLLAFAGAALVSSIALAVLIRSGRAQQIALDLPNARSLHARPVPRIGGLVSLPVALLLSLVVGAIDMAMAACALALVAVGALDDRRGLPITVRLGVQVVAAAVLVAATAAPAGVSIVGCLVLGAAAVWAMNAFNFMDGSDGLAGGMATIGFGACAVAAAASGNGALSTLCAALAGAALGFLAFNFAPARVFLGDAGSVPLGFLAAAVALEGAASGSLPVWFVPLVFSPFLVDATLTLLARCVRGERVWQAHREHLYQRMVRGGLGHRRTALLAYALMLVGALLALIARGLPAAGQTGIVATWFGLATVGYFTLRQRWPAP